MGGGGDSGWKGSHRDVGELDALTLTLTPSPSPSPTLTLSELGGMSESVCVEGDVCVEGCGGKAEGIFFGISWIRTGMSENLMPSEVER